MSLNLNPDIEARLIELAQSAASPLKTSFCTSWKRRQAIPSPGGSHPNNGRRSLKSGPTVFQKPLSSPDEALSRENLYPDRW